MSEYELHEIRSFHWPEVEDMGGGWGRSQWLVESDQELALAGIDQQLARVAGLHNSIFVIDRDPAGRSAQVTILAKFVLGPNEISATAVLLTALVDGSGGVVVINGVVDHPILKMVDISEP